MGFEEDLKARRAGILADIEELRARVATLEGVLSSFDGVIAFYDPTAAASAPSPSPKPKRTALPLPPQLQRINKTDAVFEALREAGRPITTAECAEAIGTRLGVPGDHPALPRFSSHVSATLNGLAKRDRVRQVRSADGAKRLWEVAA